MQKLKLSQAKDLHIARQVVDLKTTDILNIESLKKLKVLDNIFLKTS